MPVYEDEIPDVSEWLEEDDDQTDDVVLEPDGVLMDGMPDIDVAL